jgi:TonB family protein
LKETRKLLSVVTSLTLALVFFCGCSFAGTPTASVIALNNDAVKALNDSNYELAIKTLITALKLDPSYTIALDNLIISYNFYGVSLKQKPAQALEQLHIAMLLDLENSVTKQNIDQMLRLMHHHPNDYRERIKIAESCYKQEDYIGAATEYYASWCLHPDLALREKVDATFNQVDDFYRNVGYGTADAFSTNTTLTKSSAVKLDSQIVDSDYYMRAMEVQIKHNWLPPDLNKRKSTIVQFQIQKDGSLRQVRITKYSGISTLDRAAFDAVEHAGPFHPLPKGWPDKLNVQFTFDYNKRPFPHPQVANKLDTDLSYLPSLAR